MKTKNNYSEVNVNMVANYAQAHTGAGSMRKVTGTLNQARKSLGGIGNEAIVIGRNEKKEKIYTTVAKFMESVEIPYGNGQVLLASIKKAWNHYLCDKEGNLMLCKKVIQRAKIGKQSYVLYRQDEDGEYKAVSIYQPAAVRDTGWTPYLICEGLAQSKFIDEVKATCEKSQADFDELKDNGGLYVHDSLTGEYVPYQEKK